MLASKSVTAEAAAAYDPADDTAAREVAGDRGTRPGVPFCICGADGEWRRPRPGEHVVRFGPGDVAVMTGKEYRRWFGDE